MEMGDLMNASLKALLNEQYKLVAELKEENKKLKEKNEKLEEDNINLISFNEHYSPDVIVKYEDRYETAYNEECIENAKLCDKMRRLEEENKKLNIKVASLEGEIKGLNSTIEKLKEENQYRESVADVLPEGKGHIAEETIQDLQKEIKELKNMINTAIGIAYDKDDYDGIEYLVHERDRSEYFISKQIKDGKTKGERNHND